MRQEEEEMAPIKLDKPTRAIFGRTAGVIPASNDRKILREMYVVPA